VDAKLREAVPNLGEDMCNNPKKARKGNLPYVHEDILIYVSNLFYPLGNYVINIVEYVPNIPNMFIKQ